ncbi:unnamed protein product [Caenorhabditis auriculariae]|uniref:SXP/RAL-2 family protein Ani s 5-like cation-binding domain-containing protein n=1 Tax=Caenorhabditis auriculariae TaxID=2777116 RepID=A0A8S1HMC1_9PELO|nr:unnamed protein product [Caenorhabditis auriculariae]
MMPSQCLPVLLVTFLATSVQALKSLDQFIIELDQFIPTIQQEIDFLSTGEYADAQALHQLTSFYPTLYLTIQRLRETGMEAEKKRITTGESRGKMCGKMFHFQYHDVGKKRDEVLKAITAKNVTVQSGKLLLHAMKASLEEWRAKSLAPCVTKQP